MKALENLADMFTKAIIWIRCFFTGHEPAPVQIVPTEFQANIPDAYPLAAIPVRLVKLKLESPLYYCRKCGRLRYGP